MNETKISMLQVIDPEKYAHEGLVEIISGTWSAEDIAAHSYSIESEQVAGWGRYNRIVRHEARGSSDSWGYALALEEDAGNMRCPHCGSTAYDAHTEPSDSWRAPREQRVTYRRCAKCGQVYDQLSGPSLAERLADDCATSPQSL